MENPACFDYSILTQISISYFWTYFIPLCRPTVPNSNNSLNETGNGNPFPGLEVTFEVKFWEERSGQLEPLKTKLQTETLGSHKVSQNMTAGIFW